jgi:tetratricopeptide (TPR) repeat protein
LFPREDPQCGGLAAHPLSRYLEERNDWTTSLTLAKTSLAILSREKDSTLGYLYADVLFLLAVTYDSLGDLENAMEYARQHFEQRISVENAAGENGDLSFRAMAYTQLALGSVGTNDFEKAILLAETGREMLEKTEEYKNDTYWPHWAYWSHAWALIGLQRFDEALPLIETTLRWRERHYGMDDTESMKYVARVPPFRPPPPALFYTRLLLTRIACPCPRTAYTLQIMGILKEHLGVPDEAVNLFERSVRLFSQTIGESSYRTNQVRVKLGEHYARLKRPEAAK